VITGLELESMSQAELENIVEKTSVYARVSPEHKVRILQAFQKKGHVVAMTGDGVNDAPAIKKADVGISMGIKGTDVAKEASDLVLADDHYATIVAAIEEGRGIYANIRKFVRQMLSVNLIEVFLIATMSIAGMPLPLLPLQLLWINLVTDSFLSISLAMDPIEGDVMKTPPRKKTESLFAGGMMPFLIVTAVIGSIAAAVIFFWGMQFGIDKARTLVLTFCVMYETVILFNCRSENKPFFRMNPLSNIYLFGSTLLVFGLQFVILYVPVMQPIFSTVPLNAGEWLLMFSLCFAGLLVSPSFFNKTKSVT
jgi:Ca2+-transporting ATPase